MPNYSHAAARGEADVMTHQCGVDAATGID